MEYDKFMKGCGFSMRRYNRTITIFGWGLLITDMVHDSRITIWKQLGHTDILGDTNACLSTSETPKLHKMMLPPESKQG